jgi:hypothetical protein
MQNFFGQLYLNLADHLKNTVPEIRWIDQDFGQLERFKYRPEVAFPCALIDFIQATYSNMAELSQIAEVAVNIRLGFAPFSQSYHAAPMDVKERALEYYTIEQRVFEAVQGWHNQFSQPFVRQSATTEQRDNDEEGLRVRVLTFSTAYEDLSALPKYTRTTASLEFE